MQLTIRWRMTLWNIVAMTLVLGVIAVLIYGLLHRAHVRIDQALDKRIEALQEQIDKTLVAGLRQLEKDPRMSKASEDRLRYWIYEFKEHDNIFCVVFDGQGKLFLHTEEFPKASLPPPPSLTQQISFDDQELPILGRQRGLTSPFRVGEQTYTVVLYASLTELDRSRSEVEREHANVEGEFRQLSWVLLISLPGALILVACVGYYLARKSLAPMERLHRLAEEITAERLDRRLPVANARDELGKLTQTINAMIARLEKSFQEIRRFTADASHELRTPLAAIRTEAEVALAKPLSLEEHQHLLESILEECGRLTRLTDQLLALAREDTRGSAQKFETVDLRTVLQKVTETLRLLVEGKSQELQLHVPESLMIAGDESRLRQVFFNVLDNAIKYTPEKGMIEVEGKAQDGWIHVSVRDSGIGICGEHLSRVFERFYRVDKSRSREGTGLGLSIAKSIVTAHGGRIEISSSPRDGTTVSILLPGKK